MSEQGMESAEQRVKARWPDADAYCPISGTSVANPMWFIYRTCSEDDWDAIGQGVSSPDAWQDAASRLEPAPAQMTDELCDQCGEPVDAPHHQDGYCYCGGEVNKWLPCRDARRRLASTGADCANGWANCPIHVEEPCQAPQQSPAQEQGAVTNIELDLFVTEAWRIHDGSPNEKYQIANADRAIARYSLQQIATLRAERDEARTSELRIFRELADAKHALGHIFANNSPLATTAHTWVQRAETAEAARDAYKAENQRLREAFACLQSCGKVDDAGDFVLHLTLSKHHKSIESALLAWVDLAALSRDDAGAGMEAKA